MAGVSRKIFVNCPFDGQYKPLFEAILFCVLDCGFLPCSSMEEDDSGDVRLLKILRLLRNCKLSIHDISRTELDEQHGLPRFNMPFELGLFVGLRYSGVPSHAKKKCLILDRDPHRFQKFLSDIAGQDIRAHNDSAVDAIGCIRDWLRASSKHAGIPGANEIVRRYDIFRQDLPELCARTRLDHAKLTFVDYCDVVSQWLRQVPFDISQHLRSQDLRSIPAGASRAPRDLGTLK
jgi:hypothetical protein